jgi:hypothetical protein
VAKNKLVRDGEYGIWDPELRGGTIALERQPGETDDEYAAALEYWRTVLFGLVDVVSE